MTARATMFGLNYVGSGVKPLGGCIRDVKRAAEYLRARVPGIHIDIVTDDLSPERCVAPLMLWLRVCSESSARHPS